MALLYGFRSKKEYDDVETGCHTTDEVALQSCRQTYFLKQQNQLTQKQASLKSNADNIELQAQLDAIKNELSTLKAQQPIESSTPSGIILSGGLLVVLTLSFLVAIIVTVVITRRMIKK